MRATTPTALLRASLVAVLCAVSLSCRDEPGPTKEPTPPAPTGSSAVAPAPTSSASAPPVVPVLKVEKVGIGGTIHAVEGAIMVVEPLRVGRIVGDQVEWVKQQIPPEYPAFGPNGIDSVHGRWPDEIGVVYSNRNGRAPQPRYMPLTGKGLEHVVAGGGGMANIAGIALVGDATLMVASDLNEGLRFRAVRGHLVRKPQTPEQAGCKPGEITREPWPDQMRAALTPDVAAGTPAGTLMTMGALCESRGPAAEIWDKDGKSRIVDLGKWWKGGRFARLIPGKGDEMWAMADMWSPLLHYKDGEIEALAPLERPVRTAFASARGELHVSDGRTLFRHDGKAWVAAAHLPEGEMSGMVIDEQGAIWTSGVNRLRPDPEAKPPEARACEPFVYLYESSHKNQPNFTYPGTRKALATFPEASELALVEFGGKWSKRLGVIARSRAQAEAVAAHVRATMKDEMPRVFCFDPKEQGEVRDIPLEDKK